MPGTVNLVKSPCMAGEVTGPRGVPSTVVLLNGHVTKLSSSYAYTHGLVWLSALVKEAAFCSGQWLTKTHDWSKC